MNNADNSTELSSDEVNNRLDELYAELKTLIQILYLIPFQSNQVLDKNPQLYYF